MHSIIRALPVGLCLSLGSVGVAHASPQQVQGGGYLLPYGNVFPETWGHVVALDFDQSDLADLALEQTVLGTNYLVAMFEPGEWITRVPITPNPVSFDGMPPFGASDRAGLIVAKQNGLFLAHWKDQGVSIENRTWELTHVPCDPQSCCNPGSCCDWCDIDIVRVGDIDGLGGPDIVAVEGNTVRFLTQQGAGWDSDPGYSNITVASGSIRDLVLYDASGSGQRDHLAVVYNNKLCVYETDGTLVTWSPVYSNHRSVSATRLAHADGKEWVAWLVASNSPQAPENENQFLGFVSRSFTSPISLVDQNANGFCLRGMAAGDYDADGDDDLVFHAPLDARQILLLNQRTAAAPDLDPSNGYTIFDVPDYTGTQIDPHDAVPVFLDLDLDGDLDFAQPVESGTEFTAKVSAWRNTLVDQDAYKVTPKEVAGEPVDIELCTSGGVTSMTLSVTLPDPLPTRATHLRYLVWIKDQQGAPVDPEPYYYDDVELLTGVTDYDLSVDLDGPPPYDDSVFFWAIRLVELEEVESEPVPVYALVYQYPVANFLTAYTTSYGWPFAFMGEYLIAAQPELEVSECPPPAGEGGGGGGGGGHTGGGGSTECLPGEDPPTPKPPPGGGG